MNKIIHTVQLYKHLFLKQGIEALEFWLDPDSGTQSEPAPAPTPEPLPPAGQDQDPGQPKVFCQKGKCYPYDPARMKNQNINLEMKPGDSSFPGGDNE